MCVRTRADTRRPTYESADELVQLHETATKRLSPALWVGYRYLNAADTEREHERVRGRLGVDSEGVSAHNGGRDGGQVVAEE